MWKRLVRAAVLLMVMTGLTGCATIAINLRVHPDGTGEQEIIVLVERQALALMAIGGEDPLRQLEADLRQDHPQATIHSHREGDRVGYRVIESFQGSLTFDDEQWQGRFDIREGLFWRDYILDLTAYLPVDGVMDEMGAMLSEMDVRFSVELPVDPVEHNGWAQGRRVTWTLMPGRRESMRLRARQYHTGRIAAAGILAAGLFGAVILSAYRGQRSRPGHDNDGVFWDEQRPGG